MSDLSSRMAALEKTVSKALMLFDSVGHPNRPADGRQGIVNENGFRSARSIAELRVASGGRLIVSENGNYLPVLLNVRIGRSISCC